MNRLFLVGGFFFASLVYSQSTTQNVFNGSEQESSQTTPTEVDDADVQYSVGNPGPVPINQYIPAMFIIAMGIAAWQSKKKLKA